ncbi:hypothetical protein [Nannocystis punicea]|uniref:Uncharacterized protein n=1 Tax=Nannocystis punicea TaxID=2995304 RepID=A0ABY7HDT0_9BACT|nr:hypothetical protein [Nannocystis poenicansa]WAS97351.1 hypothetical protein O0S08_14485 [Nannocystis poenicansa]
MRLRNPRLPLLGLLLSAACGPNVPAEPGDTATDETDSSTPTTTTSTSAEPPDPTTGAPLPSTTGTETTEGDPTTSTSTSTSDTGDTTGEPVTCPEGQPPFTPLWSTVIEPPGDAGLEVIEYQFGITTMADGRLAVPFMARDGFTNKFGPGVLLTSATGEPLGFHQGDLLPGSGTVFAIQRDVDDSLLLTGRQSWVMGDETPEVKWVARFASDGTPKASAELVDWKAAWWLMGQLDVPVLLGLDGEAPVQMARLAPGDVATESIEVVSVAAGKLGALASREDGAALVAYASESGDTSRVILRGLDSAGDLEWLVELDRPDLPHVIGAVAIPDGWAVMAGDLNTGTLRLLARTAGDGGPLWEAEFAVADDLGLPRTREMYLSGDHLTIPVVRKPAPDNPFLADRTVEVHRVSLQGATLDVTPLPGAATIAGGRFLFTTLGECGELIVMPRSHDEDPVSGERLQLSAWSL